MFSLFELGHFWRTMQSWILSGQSHGLPPSWTETWQFGSESLAKSRNSYPTLSFSLCLAYVHRARWTLKSN